MRTYLVVIDETPEAKTALRFAARRAAKTGGSIALLALVPKQDFVAFASVQATMAQEARDHAQELINLTFEALSRETEVRLVPDILVRHGDPVAEVHAMIEANPDIAALVLGTAASGTPGPLVAHFTGHDAGKLRCPMMIVPGGLSDEALDRLS